MQERIDFTHYLEKSPKKKEDEEMETVEQWLARGNKINEIPPIVQPPRRRHSHRPHALTDEEKAQKR